MRERQRKLTFRYRLRLARADRGTHPLRRARQEAGFTQDDLAKLSGISRPSISDIERRRRSPYRSTRASLARALDLPESELFKP